MSLDRSADAEATPVESIDDLVAFVRAGEKPRERWRVGTEHEKLGLLADEQSPVPYDGRARHHTLDGTAGDLVAWPPIRALSRQQGLID